MASFTHKADCGVIGEQDLTVTYEVESRRPVIKSVHLGNVRVEVSYTYMIDELYPQVFEIERSKQAEVIEMRRAA